MDDVEFEWRGKFNSVDVETLHAQGFGREGTKYEWLAQVQKHSLGWVVARRVGRLIGFLNVAWDGGGHAFALDPVVASNERRQGLGRAMVDVARRESTTAGCEWLHVKFDDHLRPFYFDVCAFSPTNSGVLRVKRPRRVVR